MTEGEDEPIHSSEVEKPAQEYEPIDNEVEPTHQSESFPEYIEPIEHHESASEEGYFHEADTPTTPYDESHPSHIEDHDITPTKDSLQLIEDNMPSPTGTAIEDPLPSPAEAPISLLSEDEPDSASTSAIASPLSPSFPGGKIKKGKKDKKGKKKKSWEEDEDDGESPSTSAVASSMESSLNLMVEGKRRRGRRARRSLFLNRRRGRMLRGGRLGLDVGK